MKSSDHGQGERSNEMTRRDADSNALEQFFHSFSESPQEADQRLHILFWRVRIGLDYRLSVGASALESKGLLFALIFGSVLYFYFVHKCPQRHREIKIDISVRLSGKCARQCRIDLVGRGHGKVAVLREMQFE